MQAFIFESVGFGEWFVLLVVVLVVVGPKRLPETARKLGQYYSKFRRAAESFKRQLLDMDTEFANAAQSVGDSVNETLGDIPHEGSPREEPPREGAPDDGAHKES